MQEWSMIRHVPASRVLWEHIEHADSPVYLDIPNWHWYRRPAWSCRSGIRCISHTEKTQAEIDALTTSGEATETQENFIYLNR